MTPVSICDAIYTDIKDDRDKRIIPMRALWDTGATNSVITTSCAERLGIKPVSIAESHHAGGISIVNVYLVNIILPNRILISGVKVSECSEQAGDFDVIIGMDIITMGDFSITNVGGKTVFSFSTPSIRTIDFAEEERINDLKNKTVKHTEFVMRCPKCGKLHKLIAYFDVSPEELDCFGFQRSECIDNDILTCDNCKFSIDLREDKYKIEQLNKMRISF